MGSFTDPEYAQVGLTEARAREAHDAISVVVRCDTATRAIIDGRSEGFCKLIADRDTGKLLGAHYMGPQAATLIQQMITVLAFDLDVRRVATEQYWIHPALPEVTENALLGLEFD